MQADAADCWGKSWRKKGSVGSKIITRQLTTCQKCCAFSTQNMQDNVFYLALKSREGEYKVLKKAKVVIIPFQQENQSKRVLIFSLISRTNLCVDIGPKVQDS